MALCAASRRSMPPAGPPAASHGQPTVLHQLRPPRARLRRSRCAPATAAPQLCCPRRQLQVSRAVARPAAGLAWDGHFDG